MGNQSSSTSSSTEVKQEEKHVFVDPRPDLPKRRLAPVTAAALVSKRVIYAPDFIADESPSVAHIFTDHEAYDRIEASRFQKLKQSECKQFGTPIKLMEDASQFVQLQSEFTTSVYRDKRILQIDAAALNDPEHNL